MHLYAPNGTVEKYPYTLMQLRKDNPQVSFPKAPSDSLLATYSVYPVVATDRPTYDDFTQNMDEDIPTLIEGVWVQGWRVWDASEDEIAERTASLAASVRAERDRKLQETDWIVIKSLEAGNPVPVDWEFYRQALRDITTQEGFPRNVTWPTKP